jgi:hypothetical protein
MNHVINVRKIKSFKKTDVTKALELVNVSTKPQFYGDTFFNPEDDKQLPIVLMRGDDGSLFQLIDIKDINTSKLYSQEYREGGENPEKPNLRTDILSVGYTLEFDPPKLRLHKNGVLSIISGHTRLAILKEQGVKNIICVVYTGMDGFSDIEIERAFLLKFGGDNATHKPAGRLTKGDVVHMIESAVKKKTIPLVKEEICYFVNSITYTTGWHSKTKENLAAEVFNKYSNRIDDTGKDIVVKSFTSKPALESFKVHYPDTNNIKYIWFSTGSIKKIPYAIGEMIDKFPKAKEFRIVLHTDHLEGWNPEEAYIDRLDISIKEWKQHTSKLNVLYGKEMPSKVKFGYFVPAVSSLTPNLNEMVIIGVNDGFRKNYTLTKTKKSLNKTLGISSFIDASENEKEEVAA